MNKLLHERLRETANTCRFVRTKGFQCYLSEDLACELADEIEKDYIPRPRFEDGELVKDGDRYVDCNGNDCTISRVGMRAVIRDKNDDYETVDPLKPLKRPQPKILDADGVDIKVGDTVWTKNGESGIIASVHGSNELPIPHIVSCGKPFVRYEGGRWNYADEVSHREPDSLQRVQQLASDWAHEDNLSNSSAADFRDVMEEISDRLTAIMERDA